jgi:hypothetical protein
MISRFILNKHLLHTPIYPISSIWQADFFSIWVKYLLMCRWSLRDSEIDDLSINRNTPTYCTYTYLEGESMGAESNLFN